MLEFSLEAEKEYFIFGKSLETPFGTIRFYSYKEYQERMKELSIISFSMLKFYYLFRSFLIEQKAPRSDRKALMSLKEMDLYDFLRTSYLQGDKGYLEAYMTVFSDLITNENDVDFTDPEVYFKYMDHEQFYELREIVMTMNLLKEEKMSPNPRVQEFLEKSKRFKNKGKVAPNTETIFSSIFIESGVPYSELLKMTAYQILATYSRIHAHKDFEISSLFATVSGEVEISPWDRNSTFFDEEEVGLDLAKVKQDYNKALS